LAEPRSLLDCNDDHAPYPVLASLTSANVCSILHSPSPFLPVRLLQTMGPIRMGQMKPMDCRQMAK
jgi:hypothetical protein